MLQKQASIQAIGVGIRCFQACFDIVELRQELFDRGLPMQGRREQLLKRLVAHDLVSSAPRLPFWYP